ncbi:MAG: response regulator, partial [Vicinamibacterales bacterium]
MDMREASRPGASVLIVEDDWQISTAVQRYLARAGLRPLEPAHDGADAVRRAARERPDLVILDITLAGPLDGLDAAERIH